MERAGFSEAKCYESNSTVQRENGLKLIKLFAPIKGNKILDYGCGVGNLTKILADLVGPEGKVVGVDPDGERLQLAREKYSASNIEYIQGIHEDIPGFDYDAVFCNHALHYCPNKDAVIKQFASKLKPGGALAIIMLVEDFVEKECLPDLYGKKFIDIYSKWFHYTSATELQQIISANSFDIKHTEDIPTEYTINGVDELVNFQKTNVRGDYDDSEFNTDAMRKYYGEGEIHLNYAYFLILAFHN